MTVHRLPCLNANRSFSLLPAQRALCSRKNHVRAAHQRSIFSSKFPNRSTQRIARVLHPCKLLHLATRTVTAAARSLLKSP
jgi:hypothetical protein